MTPSEAVTVNGGTPTLTLNDGGIAIYDATTSTPTNLVFDYTVQPGDNTSDLTVTGSALNGATITDAAGNAANLAGAVGNPPGTLQIDTTPPTITSIATTPGSGALTAGQVVAITLTASEVVTVAGGTPTLTLNDGRTATYDAANSTANNLVFDYTVQPGDNTSDLTVTGSALNGATITDAAGNAANLAGAVGNPPGTLQIDTTPPTITSIATTPGSGALTAGQVVAITLTPSEAVAVAGGTPILTLNDGRTATYDAANSTANNLVFDYTVQPGDNTSDLTVTGSAAQRRHHHRRRRQRGQPRRSRRQSARHPANRHDPADDHQHLGHARQQHARCRSGRRDHPDFQRSRGGRRRHAHPHAQQRRHRQLRRCGLNPDQSGVQIRRPGGR